MPTPERGGRPEGSRVETIAVTLAVMVAAAVAAGLFLPHQALWIDETTQLSGLSLRPAGLLHWLVFF